MTALPLIRKSLEAPRTLSAEELAALLAGEDDGAWAEIFAAAREVKTRCGRSETLPRGLIECSNVCAKDCRYCGIRCGNAGVRRYRLDEVDVLSALAEARRREYPAVAFQAGEIASEANTTYYERLIRAAQPLEVTLSLGEQTEDVYRRWKEAGALRYLIRIETSNREHYARLHPPDCSFDRRLNCIRTLKRLGYVTGTGVLIGFPGQTLRDLADDIVFFGVENVDMVGMGPYIPHAETPLGREVGLDTDADKARKVRLALKMIALVRLYLQRVNIVAATALETLDPQGREKGIAAGANVIMPNLTPPAAADDYTLYPGKFHTP